MRRRRMLQSGWANWEMVSGIMCDRRISLIVKGKMSNTVIIPVMWHDAKTCAVKNVLMRKTWLMMRRWMYGVAKQDRHINDIITGKQKDRK